MENGLSGCGEWIWKVDVESGCGKWMWKVVRFRISQYLQVDDELFTRRTQTEHFSELIFFY